MQDQDQLSTVHAAVERAKDTAQKQGNNYTTATFKVNKDVKAKAEGILEQQGSDLSKFLRSCCELLVEDYAGQPIEAVVPELEA